METAVNWLKRRRGGACVGVAHYRLALKDEPERCQALSSVQNGISSGAPFFSGRELLLSVLVPSVWICHWRGACDGDAVENVL